MQNYAAGWNMAGYSPDPDNVYVTDTYRDAIAYLVDTVETWWNQDGWHFESYDDSDARYLPIHTSLHNATAGEFHDTIDMGAYDMHMWIVATDQPVDA